MKFPRGLSLEHVLAAGAALLATAFLLAAGCASRPDLKPAFAAPPSVRPAEPFDPAQGRPFDPAQGKPSGAPPQAVPKEASAPSQEAHSDRRLLEVPVDRARLAGRRAELWVTPDRGQNWTNHGEIDAAGPGRFMAPADGRFGFLIVPVADGRREFTPKAGDAPERTVVVDTVIPVVELLAPNGGEVFGAGRSTVVQWAAQDANLAPAGIQIEVSAGAADPWAVVAKDLPNTGTYHWDIRMPSTAHARLRVVARDIAGNAGSDASDNEFTVDGLAPDLRIKGPAAASESPVRIEWTGGDLGGAGLKRVSLWVTRDNGQTWTRAGDDEDLQPPFLFQDLDGVYGLRLAGEDRMGNANPAPVAGMPALSTLVLDRTKPELKLLSPREGGYLGGVAVDVRWSARDNIDMPGNAISLSYSDDGGKTWKEVARGQANDGSYKWTPPRSAGDNFRFKVAATDFAGNTAEAVSGKFGIDVEPPMALATGPSRSGSHSVQVLYEIRNRGTQPVKRVTLYYRPENVKEWLKYGDDPDAQSPVLFAKADGKYGIYVTCATEQGAAAEVAQKAPDEGTEPQITLTIDATPPQLTLETFDGGGFLLAGAAMDVVWTLVEPNPDPRGLDIFWSPDGGASWNVVATGVDPARGSHRWTIPAAGGSRHKVRLVAMDRFGHRGQAESQKPFSIDADLPTVTLLERPPAVSRGGRIAAKYRSADATSGVEKVQLWGRRMLEKEPYQVLSSSKNLEGVMECDAPGEGNWGFLLVAVDVAGHSSAEPGRLPKPDFLTAFDVTKPEVALKQAQLPQGTRTWVNPSWEVEWTAKDNLTAADRIWIRIETSTDAGKTWFPAADRHPNTGRKDLRGLLEPGKRYRIRVAAADEAGNVAEDVSADFDPGDVPPAALALRGIEEGRAYPLGSQVAVAWASSDKSVREATLEVSRDGGRTWDFVGVLNAPSGRIALPAREGRYHLRATARDSARRPVSSNLIAFETISGVEKVKVVTHATVGAGELMAAIVEPEHVLKAAREAVLEISEDGVRWGKVRDARTREIRFLAPATPGEFSLRVVVKDGEGRSYDSEPVRFRVTAEGGAAGLRLENFRGGEVFAGGMGQLILVRTRLDLSEIEAAFSQDGGKTWKPLSREVLTAVPGRGFLWRPMPDVTSRTCRLRVSWAGPGGKALTDESERDFAIDSEKPLAAVTGPAGESPVPVTLDVRLDVSIDPIEEVTLWSSEDAGASWKVYSAFKAGAPVVFAPARPGDYGLIAVARSARGLKRDDPRPGSRPQLVVKARGRAEAPPPAGPLALQTAIPEVVKGGATVELRWASSGEGKVTISFVADGKPTVIAKDQPATGRVEWAVPRVDLKECRIVVEMGEVSARSGPFEIDSSAPRIRGIEVEVPRR
jgi:hypothetical protein